MIPHRFPQMVPDPEITPPSLVADPSPELAQARREQVRRRMLAALESDALPDPELAASARRIEAMLEREEQEALRMASQAAQPRHAPGDPVWYDDEDQEQYNQRRFGR